MEKGDLMLLWIIYATLMMRWQIVSIFTLIIQSNIFLYLLVLFITPLWEKFVGRILLKILPIWSYSVNKWASEKHLEILAKKSDTNYTIIRPCVTYGDTRIPYGISPKYGYHCTLVSRILNEKPIIRWNGGVNRCNMTRVEDFAVGVVGLIGNRGAYNEAFNICGDETPSFNEVLNVLSELSGKKVKIVDVTSEFYAQELPNHAGEILGGRSILTK